MLQKQRYTLLDPIVRYPESSSADTRFPCWNIYQNVIFPRAHADHPNGTGWVLLCFTCREKIHNHLAWGLPLPATESSSNPLGRRLLAGSCVHFQNPGPYQVYPGPCKKSKLLPRFIFPRAPFPVWWTDFVPPRLNRDGPTKSRNVSLEKNKSRSKFTFLAGSWVHLAGTRILEVYTGPCKKSKLRPRFIFLQRHTPRLGGPD
jgi:hypothetical protein